MQRGLSERRYWGCWIATSNVSSCNTPCCGKSSGTLRRLGNYYRWPANRPLRAHGRIAPFFDEGQRKEACSGYPYLSTRFARSRLRLRLPRRVEKKVLGRVNGGFRQLRAMDRMHPTLAKQTDSLHLAVLRIVDLTRSSPRERTHSTPADSAKASRSLQTSKQACNAYFVVSTPARKSDYVTEDSCKRERYPATRQCDS